MPNEYYPNTLNKFNKFLQMYLLARFNVPHFFTNCDLVENVKLLKENIGHFS